MNTYKTRVQNLRQLMKKGNIDAYLVLSADPHLSEYLPEFYKNRAFISGFKGSIGTLIITQKDAFLWVDGRYWLQAEKELKHSSIELQKQDSKNTFIIWLKENLNEKENIGVDFSVLSFSLYKDLQKNCKANLKHSDFITPIWQDRPKLPKNKIYTHEKEYSVLSAKEKISIIRKKMNDLNAESHLISSLDDIAYLTNLRGSDVEYNPVFLSHLLIKKDEVLLFVDEDKISKEIRDDLEKEGIFLRSYEAIIKELKTLKNTTLLIEPLKTTALLINSLDSSVTLIEDINPSTHLKACKNDKEIKHIKNAMIQDGVALCKFFAWLEEALKNGEEVNELDIDTKVTEFRSKRPLYISNSFATIAGFNANSAFPHYKATKESHVKIKGDGFLLIDSGGQYKNGTTDITRVVPIGQLSKERIFDYTLVLKANIAISKTIFPKDITMPLLDSITRCALWEHGIDYIHGTGHGVGYFLNVHEGPQVLSYLFPALEKTRAKEGMVTSIEPGIYRKDKWGVRLENLVVSVMDKSTEFGDFLRFEILTLCPFELSCIDISMLDDKEKKWLNDYNNKVFKELSPHLKDDPKALKWLEDRTQMI